MNKVTKLAYRDLKANKKRNSLTVLSIAISVFLVYVILTFSSSFYSKMLNEMKIADENVLTVAFGNRENTLNYSCRPLFNNKDIEYIKDTQGISNVSGVKGFSVNSMKKNGGKQLLTTYIYGIDQEYMDNLGLKLSEGKMMTGENEIIIGSSIKKASDISVGDKIQVEMDTEIKEFEVVGIIEHQKEQAFSTLPSEVNQMLAMNINNKYFENVKYNCIIGKADSTKGLKELSTRIVDNISQDTALIDSLEGSGIDVIVASRQDVLDMLSRWFSYISIFVVVLAVIINFISAVNIINILSVSIKEKYKSIAVFKVVGASGKQVKEIFLKQSFLLGVKGSIIGTVIGAIVSQIAITILGWSNYLTLLIVAISLIIGIATASFAGYLGSRKAEKTKISVLLNETE